MEGGLVDGDYLQCNSWEDNEGSDALTDELESGSLADMNIRSLELPAALENAVTSGVWMRSAPGPELSGTSSWSAWNWCFYSFEQIESETETVTTIGHLECPGIEAFNLDYLLCIADRGYDWPICVVYSDCGEPGAVVGFNGFSATWEELARNFEEFAAKLVELPVVKDDEDANRRLPRGTVYITEAGKRWRVDGPNVGVY